MSSLKDRVPLIVFGVAAIAFAGYQLFSGRSKKTEAKSPKDIPGDPDVQEPDHRFFFISADFSSEQRDKAISAWVKEQILSLTEGSPLKAPGGLLAKNDFLILCSIVENRIKAYIFDEKHRLQEDRLEVLRKYGVKSDEYFKVLTEDVRSLTEASDFARAEVLTQAQCRDLIYDNSFDDHIGSEEHIDTKFVRRSLEIFYYYPIKTSQAVNNTPESLKLIYEVIETVTKDFTAKQRLEKVGFKGVQEFLLCFDMACLDYTILQKGLDEAHYRLLMMTEPEWL